MINLTLDQKIRVLLELDATADVETMLDDAIAHKHTSTKPGRLKDLEDELHRRQAARRTGFTTSTYPKENLQ